jgi:hypothetical protein
LAFSYWIDYLGFITEGKLPAIFIKPSLGVSNWPVIYIINYTPAKHHKFSGTVTEDLRRRITHIKTAPSISFLAPLPGKKKTSARGVSHAHPLLCFKFCFTLFLLASFYQKS